MTNKTNIGERIKQCRISVGMTQEEFSTEIGLTAPQLSCVERGTKGISLEKLIAICKKFHVGMDKLIPIEDVDDSLKEKWIAEITEQLREMSALELGVLRRMMAGN